MLKKTVLAALAGLLLVLILPARSRAQQDLQTLITNTRTLVLDNLPNGRERFSDSQITEWINEAQRQAIIQTHCLRQSMTFSLIPGVTYYNLPSNYLAMERVTIGQKYIQNMSMNALDGRSRGWEAASGYPTYYFTTPSSPTLVGFAPWPQQATDTDTIKMDYDVQPNDLVNYTDEAFDGDPVLANYNHALTYYAASIGAAIQGMTARSQSYLAIYQSVMMGMNKRCLEMPAYLPSATGQN